MVNTVINGLIAGVVGAVAFIAVRALVLADGTACCGDPLTVGAVTNNTTIAAAGTCGQVVCAFNATADPWNTTSNCSYGGTIYAMNDTMTGTCPQCWASVECVLMVTVLPLAIAILTIAGLFLGLTKMRGL